jgi:hypothetical protein
MAEANLLSGANALSAGDTVYYSGLNTSGVETSYSDHTTVGAYISCMHTPSGGSVGSPVTYEGIPDGTGAAYPLIDLSTEATTNTLAICMASVDYVTVNNFRVKGSGQSIAAVRAYGTTGTAGAGNTVTMNNVSVLQGYNTSDVTKGNDCFSCYDTAQLTLNNVSADKCRRGDATTGSNQCFTTHTDSKMTVNTGTCTDSDYLAVATVNSQITLNDVVASGARVKVIDGSTDATSTGFVKVNRGTITVDVAAFGGVTSGANNTLIQVNDANVVISLGGTSVINGGTVQFNRCNITYTATGVQAWSVYAPTAGSTSSLQIYDSTITLPSAGVNIDNTFPTSATSSATMNIERNIITGNSTRLVQARGSGVVNFKYNTVTDFNTGAAFIWLRSETPTLNMYNNTFYRSSKAGTVITRAAGSANLSNNIFYKTQYVCDSANNCAATGFTSSYNIFYGGDAVTNPGTGSLTVDPLLVSASDYNLQRHSPAARILNDLRVSVGCTDLSGVDVCSCYLGGEWFAGAYAYLPDPTGECWRHGRSTMSLGSM